MEGRYSVLIPKLSKDTAEPKLAEKEAAPDRTAKSTEAPPRKPSSDTLVASPTGDSLGFAQLEVVRKDAPFIGINKNLLRLDWIKDWTNLVVAGGHILNAVINDSDASLKGDIDIFLVEEDGAPLGAKRVAEILRSISGWINEYYPGECQTTFNAMGVTFILPQSPELAERKTWGDFSFVTVMCTKSFKSVFDVLMGFDMANCEFAYRAGKLYATEDAIQYVKDGKIFVYEANEALWKGGEWARKHRLQKYGGRAYNTIVRLPGFRPGRPHTLDEMYVAYATHNVQPKPYDDWKDLDATMKEYAARVGKLLSGYDGSC